MSVSTRDIIDLAQSMLEPSAEQPITEATLRCSTSRAYYAALHSASQSLPPERQLTGEEKRGKSSHQAVIDAFISWAKSLEPGRQEAIVVARNLPKLKDARKSADYRLKSDFTLTAAQQALKIALATIDSAERAGQRSVTLQA